MEGVDKATAHQLENKRNGYAVRGPHMYFMGKEMDEETIPGATGVVDRSASFTKGCYTGQELVARVDSRVAGVP